MSTITLFAYILIAVFACLSLFVALSRTANVTKINFVLLNIAISVWILSNTYADLSTEWGSLMWTRLTFASGAASLTALLCFVLTFPRYTSRQFGSSLMVYLALIPIVILSFSTYIVPAVNTVSGRADVVAGSLYGLYTAYVVIIIGASIATLIHKWKNEKGGDKQRLVYVFWGVTITTVIAVTNNLLVPLITGTNPYAIYGTFSLVILIAALAYAIFRHKLFSIRLATARAVAYTLSGASLAFIFVAVLFIAEQIFFNSTKTSALQRVFYGVSAVLVGFSFPVIRSFFNSITRRILLNDGYDIELVLASIANIAANSSSSHELFLKANRELQESIHLESVATYINKNSHLELVFTTSKKKIPTLDFDLDHYHKKMNVIDLVKVGSPLADHYALLLILSTSTDILGCVAIGPKKNGFAFNKQDIQMFEGIAHELSVATENMVRFEEIKKFNETLQGRIQEATSALRVNNKKLRDLDATKDEFISMASHQLRTPLTSVKGYLSMVLEGDVGEINPQQRKLLEEAFASSQRMVYLIGDFLNVSRIQTGKFELERSDVSLPSIISEEISQLKATAKSRGIELAYEAPRDFPVMKIDENKIRQVMMNFIDNAIYYSPENTTITVSLAKFDNRIEFKVRDQGIGVPKEAQQHLFTKFFRADNAKQQRPDGTGIGLFMAKKVVIEHGGAILFESQPGKGSMFGFRLPVE